MYNLPSKQKQLAEEALNEFRQNGCLSIHEPCDCGSQIRHNNGGNYHDEIDLAFDSGKYFRRDDTTCELTETPDWEEVTEEEAISAITEYADWL